MSAWTRPRDGAWDRFRSSHPSMHCALRGNRLFMPRAAASIACVTHYGAVCVSVGVALRPTHNSLVRARGAPARFVRVSTRPGDAPPPRDGSHEHRERAAPAGVTHDDAWPSEIPTPHTHVHVGTFLQYTSFGAPMHQTSETWRLFCNYLPETRGSAQPGRRRRGRLEQGPVSTFRIRTPIALRAVKE